MSRSHRRRLRLLLLQLAAAAVRSLDGLCSGEQEMVSRRWSQRWPALQLHNITSLVMIEKYFPVHLAYLEPYSIATYISAIDVFQSRSIQQRIAGGKRTCAIQNVVYMRTLH